MKLRGRKIYGGKVKGNALVSSKAISFYGGVDARTGKVIEKSHPLQGKSISGKILVFPNSKGSTVGSYVLYRLKKNGKAPKAMVLKECETIVAVGAIIAEIPCMDKVNIKKIKNNKLIEVNTERGEINA